MDFYEEAMRDLAKGKAFTRYIETRESFKRPKGVKISKEEQAEEEDFYRENPDAPPASWGVGGWAERKDELPKEKRTVCRG